MNSDAFLCHFPTVFGQYIRILDQVSKIRRFHSIPFEFQGFENRPQICFLPFRYTVSPGEAGYSHILPIWVCAAQRGRDFEVPDLERGIHLGGVF